VVGFSIQSDISSFSLYNVVDLNHDTPNKTELGNITSQNDFLSLLKIAMEKNIAIIETLLDIISADAPSCSSLWISVCNGIVTFIGNKTELQNAKLYFPAYTLTIAVNPTVSQTLQFWPEDGEPPILPKPDKDQASDNSYFIHKLNALKENKAAYKSFKELNPNLEKGKWVVVVKSKVNVMVDAKTKADALKDINEDCYCVKVGEEDMPSYLCPVVQLNEQNLAFVQAKLMNPKDPMNSPNSRTITMLVDTGASFTVLPRREIAIELNLPINGDFIKIFTATENVNALIFHCKVQIDGMKDRILDDVAVLFKDFDAKGHPTNFCSNTDGFGCLGQSFLTQCKHTWSVDLNIECLKYNS